MIYGQQRIQREVRGFSPLPEVSLKLKIKETNNSKNIHSGFTLFLFNNLLILVEKVKVLKKLSLTGFSFHIIKKNI